MRPWVPVIVAGFGFALIASWAIRWALVNLREVSPSMVILILLVPVMLAGQVILAETGRKYR